MRTSELLADFISDLGYNITLVEIPFSTPMHNAVEDDEFLDLIVFSTGRDGVIPDRAEFRAPNWCTIQTFHQHGRLACRVTIDVLGHLSDPHASSILYLDDPTLFSSLTAFLDHWYFRVFHAD
jgi:hypothetical protein